VDEARQIKNIRTAFVQGIIDIGEAFETLKAIRVKDFKIIGELYERRQKTYRQDHHSLQRL